MGLRCLDDVELFVPVLGLNLETEQDVFEHVSVHCCFAYENKYGGERIATDTLFNLNQAICETRQQIKAAFDRRVVVLDQLRQIVKLPSDTRPYPRDTRGQASLQVPHPGLDPEYILTPDEMNFS